MVDTDVQGRSSRQSELRGVVEKAFGATNVTKFERNRGGEVRLDFTDRGEFASLSTRLGQRAAGGRDTLNRPAMEEALEFNYSSGDMKGRATFAIGSDGRMDKASIQFPDYPDKRLPADHPERIFVERMFQGFNEAFVPPNTPPIQIPNGPTTGQQPPSRSKSGPSVMT